MKKSRIYYLLLILVQISVAEEDFDPATQQLQHEENLSSATYDDEELPRMPEISNTFSEKKTPLDMLLSFVIKPVTVRPTQSTKKPTTVDWTSPTQSTVKPTTTTLDWTFSTQSSEKPTTTTSASTLAESTDASLSTTLTDRDVRNADPFYMAPQAVQVNCTSIGVDCKNCSYVDWLKIYNKTIDGSVAAGKYKNVDEKKCFQQCNATITCVLYTFNTLNGIFKIYNELKFENIQNDTNWSMFVRISPRFIFLSEWIVTRDAIPRGAPINTASGSNFFNCTALCANTAKCVFATLNRSNNTCSLFEKSATELTALKGNHVSIQHISLSRNDEFWRFRGVGPVYQMEVSPTGLATESLESCLEYCNSEDSCQLVTTVATAQGNVDCFLYADFENRWFEDDSPSKAKNSYYKLIDRNNTQYRKQPHYVTVASTSKPMESKRISNLAACHRKAMDSFTCHWYNYNSTSKICKLYNSAVQIVKVKSSIRNDLTTFTKSIPTDYLPFYGFDSIWMTKISLNDIPTSGRSCGQQCLGRCLELANCSGVAIQRPAGNCSLYAQSSLITILKNLDRIPDVGLQTIQMFVKAGDPRFIRSERQFRCLNKPLVTWDEINQILQFDSLDKDRNDIPRGNNLPLSPHGDSFEGVRNGTSNLVSVQSFKMTKVERSDLRSLEIETSKTYIIELSQLVGITVLGITGLVVTGPIGAAIGAAIGVAIGTIASVGTILVDSFTCLFKDCNKKIEKDPCGKRCALHPDSSDCICNTQPEVRGGYLLTHCDDRFGNFQEVCKGKTVGQYCRICCRVGYKAEDFPACTCSENSGSYWNPHPARRVGSDICYIGPANWGNTRMKLLKVSDCLDNLYYGLVFNTFKQLPFYTVYQYTLINHLFDNPELKSSNDWVALACTDIAEDQLTHLHYQVLNQDENGNINHSYDKGHLAPNADLRYCKDAQKATHVYANSAPQDAFSNRVPWRTIEGRIRKLLAESMADGSTRAGFVITGVCLESVLQSRIHVPACFWKLVCTRTNTEAVTVAGFYHENIVSQTKKEEERREAEVYQLRDQRSMPHFENINIDDLWLQATSFFKEETDRDFMFKCQRATKIEFPNILPKDNRAAGDYTLYNFWNEKLFGEGFDRDSVETEDETIVQSSSGSPPSCGSKVVGYVTGWSDVKFTASAASYLTHVIFAFVQMKSDGKLVVGSADPENSNDVSVDTKKSYLRLYEIKAAKEASGYRLKTIFAVGGWANSQFYSIVAGSADLTQNFIRSAIEILSYFNMDGIDIDWEYPVTGGANVGIKQDRQNYVRFLKSLKAALATRQSDEGRFEPYSVTIAGAAGSWVLDDGFDLPAIAEIVDWINVMTYDYNGAWESKWGAYTGPHAPLYYGAPPGYSGKTNVDYTMKYYSCRIQNPEKLVMGLGFYGRFWNNSGKAVGENPLWRMANRNAAGKFDGGFEPWRSVVANYIRNPSFIKSYDLRTETPYLQNSAGFLMGYENTRSIHEKVRYAAAKKFAGVMIWAVDLDDPENSLLRTASSETLCSSDGEISFNYKCPPIEEQRWWTLLDDTDKAGMCGKAAPLYKGYYPVCDPEDPGYACCSASGYCGTGDKFCNCDGCVNYYKDPEKILDEPIRPTSPVRWHTMDKFQEGPQCGYLGHKLENGEFAICNPDDDNGFCCSAAGYCGKKSESCDCEGCVNFKKNPKFQYPAKTWIDSGPDAGKCGKNANVNGKPATCNPLSKDYYCCSASGYCGSGSEYCNCNGCVNYKNK